MIAACAREASAHILAYARDAGLDRSAFLVKVAAVLVSAALAAQPEDHPCRTCAALLIGALGALYRDFPARGPRNRFILAAGRRRERHQLRARQGRVRFDRLARR